MARNRKIETVVILESRFQPEDRRVWFGKAKLLAEQIVLKGWGYSKRIPLASIREVRWSSDILVLVCDDSEEVELIISSAALWKYELQARCGLKNVVAGSFIDRRKGREEAGSDQDSKVDSLKVESEADGAAEVDGVTDVNGADKSSSQPADEDQDSQSGNSYRIRSAYAEDRPGSSGR